jgi:hypothetical protein
VGDGESDVTIANVGQGILPWRARPGQTWITIDQQAGVALSGDVPCESEDSCVRSPALHITVDGDHATGPGWINIDNLITGNTVQIDIQPGPPDLPGDANCDGVVNALDAAAVLQYGAGLVNTLPCLPNANASVSGAIDGLDALLILQYAAGLVASLPPGQTPTPPPATP